MFTLGKVHQTWRQWSEGHLPQDAVVLQILARQTHPAGLGGGALLAKILPCRPSAAGSK